MAGFSDLYMKDREQDGGEREKVERRESQRTKEVNVERESEGSVWSAQKNEFFHFLPSFVCHSLNNKEGKGRKDGMTEDCVVCSWALAHGSVAGFQQRRCPVMQKQEMMMNREKIFMRKEGSNKCPKRNSKFIYLTLSKTTLPAGQS